jgi:hypothetical protein
MKKKRIRICGRKTTTDPIPPMTPSTTSDWSVGVPASIGETQFCTAAMPASIRSMSGAASV